MEIKEGSVRINRKEMQEIKRMDHRQMEGKLQEAYDTGVNDGLEAGKTAGRAEAGTDAERNWRQSVEATLEETKGIGPGRKALFLERLDRKIRGQQEPEKTQ